MSTKRFSVPSARSKTLIRRNMLSSLDAQEDTDASWLNDVLPGSFTATSKTVQTQEHTVSYEDLPTMPLSAFMHPTAVQAHEEDNVLDDRTIRLANRQRRYNLHLLDALLQDDTVSAITALGPERIFVERDGMIQQTALSFACEQHMIRVIEEYLCMAQCPISLKHPLVDVALPDGLLLTAVLPPNALNGPALTLRKARKSFQSLTELVQRCMCDRVMADQLYSHIRARSNLLIVGPLGSGRTTLLNALCALIPTHERVVTIEDVVELKFPHSCRIALQTNRAEHIGTHELLASVEHLGMQRLVVGECRGNEAEMLLQSMYSGLNGVMTTLYALSAQDCLRRFETLCALARNDVTPSRNALLRTQIRQSIDVIVTLSSEHKIIDMYEVKRDTFVL